MPTLALLPLDLRKVLGVHGRKAFVHEEHPYRDIYSREHEINETR